MNKNNKNNIEQEDKWHKAGWSDCNAHWLKKIEKELKEEECPIHSLWHICLLDLKKRLNENSCNK